MLYLGCHLSPSDGFAAMGRTCLSLGGNTCQFFTRNPRGSRAKSIDPADAEAFRALAAEKGIGTVVAHANSFNLAAYSLDCFSVTFS